MKCKDCKEYVPFPVLDGDLKETGELETWGDCSCKKIVRPEVGEDTIPNEGEAVVKCGVMEFNEMVEFIVDENFGCINFKEKKDEEEKNKE